MNEPLVDIKRDTQDFQRRIQMVATVAAATVRFSSQNLKIAQIGKG